MDSELYDELMSRLDKVMINFIDDLLENSIVPLSEIENLETKYKEFKLSIN